MLKDEKAAIQGADAIRSTNNNEVEDVLIALLDYNGDDL